MLFVRLEATYLYGYLLEFKFSVFILILCIIFVFDGMVAVEVVSLPDRRSGRRRADVVKC